jgi:glycosyltransferase involved in cell wall biosynthesis
LKSQIERYVLDNGMSSYVMIKKYEENIAYSLRSVSLLMFLSTYESFGNIVVESILCGTPVIVGDIPSMKEIFQNYPDFLVELNSPDLAKQIIKKIHNYESLKTTTEKAHTEFKSRFSLNKHLQILESIYESI